MQEAFDTMWSLAGSYLCSFTPMTYMGASAEGAEMTTFLAPPFRCALACNTGQCEGWQKLPPTKNAASTMY